mgnify:CR=1 FL=1
MKKKLACMLLMSALALSMTACGGKDNNGAASDNQQSTMESTAAGQETGEAGSTTAAQNPKDAAKECKKGSYGCTGRQLLAGFRDTRGNAERDLRCQCGAL